MPKAKLIRLKASQFNTPKRQLRVKKNILDYDEEPKIKIKYRGSDFKSYLQTFS